MLVWRVPDFSDDQPARKKFSCIFKLRSMQLLLVFTAILHGKKDVFFELNSATSLVHRPHSIFGHTQILYMCSFHYCIVCLPNISNVYKLLARLLLMLTVYIIHENEILSTSKFVPTCVLFQVLSVLIQCFSGLAARHQAHLCYWLWL